MRKCGFLAIICLILFVFAVDASAGLVPLFTDCDFQIKGDDLEVTISGLEPIYYSLKENELTVVGRKDGKYKIAIHKKKTIWWKQGGKRLYLISLEKLLDVAEYRLSKVIEYMDVLVRF